MPEGQPRRYPYHSLLQLRCTLILEDGQPMVKGDDHKGSQGHGLVISYQAPLVGARRKDVSQEGEGPGEFPPTLLGPASGPHLHAPVDNWTGVLE